MEGRNIRRGVSKAEWLEAALQFLTDKSVADITVEGLARSLGIAKAGFYWHFKNRQDFLYQLLDFWNHEMTEVISENPQIRALDPKSRLTKIAEMVLEDDLSRYEIIVRQWALQDAKVARVVQRVNRIRLDFVSQAFAELGFSGDELEMRAMLFVCYQTWETPMFQDISRKRRRRLIAKRIKLLTGS